MTIIAVLKLFGSLFGGGLTGVIGNWLNQRSARSDKALDHEQEMARMDKEMAMMAKEAELAVQRETVKWEGQEGVELARGRQIVFQVDEKPPEQVWDVVQGMLGGGFLMRAVGAFYTFFLLWVYILRRMVRPAATAWCLFAFGWLCVHVMQQLQQSGVWDSVVQTSGPAMFEYIIHSAAYGSGVVLSFWFCERNRVKPPGQKGS